ncbi:MAG TPA: helix-turn-helix domain-containing protein [Allosphingosinicella sp.]|nr:helix-turn-helix domain-containing protein [Allosphingosinicella sp.]
MIGDRIRALREARSWTQGHLADAAGISLRTVQRLETLHSCAPETLLALAAALEVDVRSLTEERIAPSSPWRGPSPRKAALWGALLALPCLLFVAANLFKYGLGWAYIYDVMAAAGGQLGMTGAFDAAAPFLLLGGPLLAVLLNLRALVRPRLHGSAVVALEYRLSLPALAVLLAAGAGAAILSAYLVSESLGHLARGAL